MANNNTGRVFGHIPSQIFKDCVELAEAAHIKLLGQPHNRPDVERNILCLCLNHHVLFDNGGFTIANDLKLVCVDGELKTVTKHKIELEFMQYHRWH